jgi:hypothetical protein
MVLRIWKNDFVTGFQNDHAISIWVRKKVSIRQWPGITGTRQKEVCIENGKKDRTFAARKLMGPDHHRVFMYTSDLFISNQKECRQRRLAIFKRFNGRLQSCYVVENSMSDLGFKPREVWKQPYRLPAEGRLGNSENTSKLRRCLFLFPAWPSLNMCHLLGIRDLLFIYLYFEKCVIGN